MFHAFILTAALATASAPAPELSGNSSAKPAPTKVSAAQFAANKPATSGSNLPGGYVPKTKHDNSPYRFDMQQNGRRMTAAEFDAWMKSRGIRVATGKPASTAAPAATATAAATNCKATTTVAC